MSRYLVVISLGLLVAGVLAGCQGRDRDQAEPGTHAAPSGTAPSPYAPANNPPPASTTTSPAPATTANTPPSSHTSGS